MVLGTILPRKMVVWVAVGLMNRLKVLAAI